MTLLLPGVLAFAVLALVWRGALPSAWGLLAVSLVIAAVYWHVRKRLAIPLFLILTVVVGAAVLLGPRPPGAQLTRVEDLQQEWRAGGALREDLPVMLHMVFDEMLSTGAIDDTYAGGAVARQTLYSVGERFRLRTYDSVYSRSFETGASLPNLFNAEYRGKTHLPDQFAQVLEAVPQNAYFDEMDRRGYRTIVFQGARLNFCAHASVDRCETFPSFDPAPLEPTTPFRARVGYVLGALLHAYEPSYVALYGRRLVAVDDRDTSAFEVLGSTAWFNRFLRFVERVPRGTHVFAHFPLPRAPYLLTADCAPGGGGETGYHLARRFSSPTARAAALRKYSEQYFAQLGCVATLMSAFFEVVARNPSLHDARIIMHGDHGSRISVGNLLEDYRREDFVANYATYFAVRSPEVAPGIDCQFQALAEAFRSPAAAAAPGPIDRSVPPPLVQSKANDDVVVEAAMPRFGCAAR